MPDRPAMFGPTRGFSGMADLVEPWKCGADPCCNEILARHRDPVTYRLVSLLVSNLLIIIDNFSALKSCKKLICSSIVTSCMDHAWTGAIATAEKMAVKQEIASNYAVFII